MMETRKNKYKPAVIYARYSSSAQTEQSIEGQLSTCYEFAERENYTVIKEYIDRAMTGRNDDRPAFQEMISDSASGEFEFVIVYKLDRFARNRYDASVRKFELKKNGVKLISAMENIGDSAESIIFEAVLEAYAEYYSVDLAQKVKRGRLESAKKGKYLGGTIPLGYKVIDHFLYVDEDKAPYVKMAFEEYANGARMKDVVQMLNDRGLRNTKGTLLTPSSLQRVFNNKKYIGILEQEGIEMSCPKIVDKKTFDKVQERLKDNYHKGGRYKAESPYLFSGKIYCGYCGALMQGVSGTSKTGEPHYYYSCPNKRKHNCEKKNERREPLESSLAEKTIMYVLNPDYLEEISQKVVDEYYKAFSDDDKLKELKRQEDKITREIAKITSRLPEANEIVFKLLGDKITALQRELDGVQLDIKKLTITQRHKMHPEDVADWLGGFCVGDIEDEKFRNVIIEAFINKIFLFNDKAVIYYNAKDKREEVKFEDMKNLVRTQNEIMSHGILYTNCLLFVLIYHR